MTARGSNVITDLLRDSIIHLCKSNVLYDGQVEVDGIICISGQVEGQQLVVKVHETFESFTSPGCKVDGGRRFENDRGDGSFLDDGRRTLYQDRKRRRLQNEFNDGSYFRFNQFNPFPISARMTQDYDLVAKDLSMKASLLFPRNSVPHDALDVQREQKSCTPPPLFPSLTPLAIASSTSDLQLNYSNSASAGQYFMKRPSTEDRSSPSQSLPVSPDCKVCNCHFNGLEALSEHNEAAHSLFTCHSCFKTFTSRSNLERHSRLHTGHKPYSCLICGKAFSRKDHLSNHTAKHAFKCSTCSKRYADHSSLASHIHYDHGTALTNICNYCNKGFTSEAAFEDHVKSHPQYHPPEPDGRNGEPFLPPSSSMMKNFACRQCGFESKDVVSFIKHQATHSVNPNVYSCLICGRSFEELLKYSDHLLEHRHEAISFKFPIPNSLRLLPQYKAVGNYEQSDFPAPGEKQLYDAVGEKHFYECNCCDKTFQSFVDLQEHVVCHKTVTPESNGYPCAQCHDCFEDAEGLSVHLESTGHSPDACNGKDLTKKDKRKQKIPKPVLALNDNNENEDSEIEVVEPESPGEPRSGEPESGEPGSGEPGSGEILKYMPDNLIVSENGGARNEIKLQPMQSIMNRPVGTMYKVRDYSNSEPNDVLSENGKRSGEYVSLNSYAQWQNMDSEDAGDVERSLVRDGPGRAGLNFARETLSEKRANTSSQNSLDNGTNNNIPVIGMKNEHQLANGDDVPLGPQSCAICLQKFESFEDMDGHCFSEHSRSACRYCSKTFAQKANRDRHMCLHTGNRPYGCPDCEERFSRGDKLKMHRIRAHGVLYPAYSCRQKDFGREYSVSPSLSLAFDAYSNSSFMSYSSSLGSVENMDLSVNSGKAFARSENRKDELNPGQELPSLFKQPTIGAEVLRQPKIEIEESDEANENQNSFPSNVT